MSLYLQSCSSMSRDISCPHCNKGYSVETDPELTIDEREIKCWKCGNSFTMEFWTEGVFNTFAYIYDEQTGRIKEKLMGTYKNEQVICEGLNK